MRLSLGRLVAGTAFVLALLAVGHEAGAVGTRTFTLDTLEKLSGGDLTGVAVSSDGTVRAGLTLGSAPLPAADATATFSAITLADGTSLVGTGPSGKVFRVTGDTVSLFAETGALAVTSLVQAKGGAVFAATIPDGKIFRLSQGKAEVFATLPDASHVWALALDRAGTGLYAAAGSDGRVFHVDPSGRSSVYFRTTEAHLVSVAVADDGAVYAGASGKARLYRITGPGRATVAAELPGDEVKAIAIQSGFVWAIANEYGEPPEVPKRTAGAAHSAPGPAPAAKTKPGKGQVWRLDPEGRPERMMKHDDTHYMSLALDERGRAYVGTGHEGRVYSVDDAHAVTLVADTDERQASAVMMVSGKGFVATSDPPVFRRVTGRGGAEAVWTSKVLDAGLRAKFGTLGWRSTGPLELSTRTGNTQTPDGSWSPWSAAMTNPGVVASPQGRFVQVRARWSRDANAVLGEVTVPFITDNVRPVVTEVQATTKGAPAKEPSGTAIPASGGEPPKRESVVKVTWKVDNADSDPLRYRVAFRREGQSLWRDAHSGDDPLTKAELDWETSALPEGKYRLRVEASDETSNAPGQAMKHTLESEPLVVDNTPPRIEGLAVNGRRLSARIVDGASPIARVEVAIDGKSEWRPLAAKDGLFDTTDEFIEVDVGALAPPGAHLFVVRAYDSAGNSTAKDVEANLQQVQTR